MVYRWHRALPFHAWIGLALLTAALAWDASALDLPLARLAGSEHGFPWRDHWWTSTVLHEGARRLAWLLALALCVGVWWPFGPLRRLTTARRAQLAASTLLAAFAVALLKQSSHTSCPWDLAEFGGVARYTSHWSGAVDGGSGQCFPAGHASSGFSFAGGYFAFRGVDERLARAWLAASVATGLLLGLAQQWRGAHFMSHTLWTAVVCWGMAWMVDAAWPRGAGMQAT